MAIFENIWVEEKFLTKISKFFSIFWDIKNPKSIHISKTFSPITPLLIAQSTDLIELYNFAIGTIVNGWDLTYTFGRFLSEKIIFDQLKIGRKKENGFQP